MKVLTIHEPWAMLIMTGIKTVENRTWETEYRGQIGIHVGKKFADSKEWIPALKAADQINLTMECLALASPSHRGRGMIVGTIDLISIDHIMKTPFDIEGQSHWRLENPTFFDEFIEARGMQGLWNYQGDNNG